MGFLIVWLLFGVATGVIAAGKGRSGLGWFLLGCVIGVFGLVIIACLPSLKAQEVVVARADPQLTQPTKTCPECAETVLSAANVCKHCGHRFDGQMRTA